MAKSEHPVNDNMQKPYLTDQIREQFKGKGAIISIAGSDGAGKTTLTGQIVDTFAQAGLSVRRIHCYAWYKNLFVMPFRLAILKSRGVIVVLDRSIFDNIIEFARKTHLPRAILLVILSSISTLHSRFDHRIVLWASLEKLMDRRPEEKPEKLERNRVLYSALTESAQYQPVEANGPILLDVLQIIFPRIDIRPSDSALDRL